MNRKIKLLILIILSLSVYFIYKNTDNQKKILILGDNFTIGNNHVNYINSLKESIHKEADINQKYSKKDLTIEEAILLIENNSSIKKDLLESHFLILNLGYNDYLIEKAYQEAKIKNTNPLENIQNKIKELLIQIRKYYKRDILVIGYPEIDSFTRKINILFQEKNIIFLDINQFIKTKEKALNQKESELIGMEIKKILEKEQII